MRKLLLVGYVLSGLTNAFAGNYGSSPRDIVTSGSYAYFCASDTTSTRWLYRTDGTATGTVKITQNGLDYSLTKGMAAANGYLYFRSVQNFAVSTLDRMCRSDGTDLGTTQVAIRAGYTDSFGEQYAWFTRPRFLQAGNRLYFSTQTSIGNSVDGDLDTINLDDSSTTRIPRLNVSSGPNGLLYGAAIGSTLYFDYAFATNTSQQYALFKTQGTDVTTTGVCPLPAGSNPSFDMWRVPSTNVLVLGVSTPQYGREVWRSDGTDAGTTIIKDINTAPRISNIDSPDNGASLPHFIGEMGGYVYFTASIMQSQEVLQLWRTDGTSSGTTLVKSLPETTGLFAPSATELNGNLYFPARTATTGMELWKSDGTDAGTTLVKAINSSAHAYPQHFMQINASELIFTAIGPNGLELWKTNGTAAGTVEVKDINPGPNGSTIMEFCKLPDGIVLFRADDGQTGSELWRTDGTTTGTYRVADLNLVSTASEVQNWTQY